VARVTSQHGAVPVPAPALIVSDQDMQILRSWIRSSSIEAGLAERARIVMLAAEGVANTDIAERLGVSRPTVIQWRQRYESDGVEALADRPRSGRPREIDDEMRLDIVARTLAGPPKRSGVTHWSTRLLAHEAGVSNFTIAIIWREFGLKPHRTQTFKFSTDPELVARIRDVVGLYLNPPEQAIVLCVDEKSQIQALERTQPILPIRPGLPERATHDYVRHGTATLFAALEVATGRVTQQVFERHRHQEFLRFLKRVAKAYPRRTCTSCWTTTAPTPTRSFGNGWSDTPGSTCTSRRRERAGSTWSRSSSGSSPSRPSDEAVSRASRISSPPSGTSSMHGTNAASPSSGPRRPMS
jgi:transposase